MKKLLYSGLMALMMFFAIGTANAQKVTITLGTGNVPEWTLGSEDVLNFVVTITEDEGNTLVLGTAEGNFAVKVGFVAFEDQANWDNVIAAHTQVLTAATTPLVTTSFTEEAEYKVVYKLVKGDDNDVDFAGTATLGNNTTFFDVVTDNPNPYTIEFKDGRGDELDADAANTVVLNYPSINIKAYFGTGNESMAAKSEIYYVFLAEGETAVEPTREAYNAADNNGKIKKAVEMTSETSVGGNSSLIYTDDATAKTVKIKAYLTPDMSGIGGFEPLADGDGDDETTEYVTETYSFGLAFSSTKATTPALSPANGNVELGSTIKITNFEEISGGDEEGEIWYSVNGKTPLYGYMMVDEEAGIRPCIDGEIAVDGSVGDQFTLKVINYGYTTDGLASSEMVTATYTIVAAENNDPVLTVTPAANGTKGEDDVITFNGMAAFNMSVSAPRPEHDSLYKIKAELWTKANFDDMENGAATTTDWSDVTDTHLEYVDAYNGDYVVIFSLQYYSKLASDYTPVGDEQEIHFTVTNLPAPVDPIDPELTVVAAGKNTMSGETVVFDGTAAFNLKASGELIEGDSLGNYTITAELYTKLAFDTMGKYITTYSYNAADTTGDHVVAEFVGVYNGEYAARFFLTRVNGMQPEELEGAINMYFNVTNNEAPVYVDPTFAVAVAGKNEIKENTVVFDGPAAFTMKVGEMSEGDSLKIAAVIYTKINFDTFGEPITTNSYVATDTNAEFLGIYNGEYAVRFQLQRYSLMLRDFSAITDTVFYFNVTNYEEVIENYEVTVEPVGATKDGENYKFAAAEVAFDIAVKGMEADDNLVIYANVYTKKQYDTMGEVEPKKVAAAASVRFNDTLADGEYVAEFQLMRTTERGDVATNAEVVTIKFTVEAEEENANEAAELAGVNVYPNPNAGTFNVAVPERARIDIFGLNGAKVLSREVNAGVEAFQLNHSGIYFVRVMAGNKTAVKRVVVR